MVSFTTNRHRNLCWRVHLLSPSWQAIFCLVLHAVTMHLQTVDAAQPSTILELKMFYQTNCTQVAKITPRLLLHDVICSKRGPFRRCQGWRECTAHFLSLVTLTFDLDIPTSPSERPNTSSMWIWHKSIQQFPRYFIHKQTKKQSHKQQTALKQNLTCEW